MGTTMIYLIGGMLTVGAAVLLITKKRMDAEK
ncbi:MAG: LPXTG cell wall anchor domain-containing protein [Erysipelotrichaceae bacterium]|nr:LPXTG cell wall anchor domain-containing protein [Erysipelotrichaceae bacterium]